MTHILIGNDSYWTNFLGTFDVTGECSSAILCIKSNGDIQLETIMKDGTQHHISGLADRLFLINFLEKLDVPAGNHVLEICLEVGVGQIATLTYTCACDMRIKEIDWTQIEIFHDEMR